MGQTIFKKTLFFIATLILVFSFSVIFIYDIPVNSASALPITQQESLTENVDSMKYGYNVTSGKSLLKDGLCKNEAILKPINEGLYKYIEKFENVSETRAGSFSRNTTLEIAEQYGRVINGGLGGAYGKISSVALDIDTEFGLEKERSEVVDELFEVYYQRQPRVQYIIQDNVDLRDYISENLKNDFKAVNNVNDATILLKKYGTHLFTGFTYGGLMQVCNYQSTKKVEEKLSTSMTLNEKMEARINAFRGNESFSFEEQFAKVERAGTRISKYTSTLYGGDGVTGATVDHLFSYVSGPFGEQGYFIYGKWVDSINDGKRLAIIDIPTSARAIPLWELLPSEPGFSQKRNIIIDAYALMCGDKYNEYCQKYPLVNRKLSSGNEEGSVANINGYTLTYKGNTSYNQPENTETSVVGKGAIINMNYKYDGMQPNTVNWAVTNASAGNIVEVIDARKGIFKVNDAAINNATFSIELQNKGTLIPGKFLDFKVYTDPFSGGDGTPENPYVISCVNDLKELSTNSEYWSKNFVLANNIDCKNSEINGIGDVVANNGFSGTFDGNYCTIKNFSIVNPRGTAVGLFAYVEPKGIIKNLTLNNVNVKMANVDNAVENAGVLTGVNKGQIENCKLEDITLLIQRNITDGGNNSYTLNVGAFAGKLEGEGKISLCSLYNTATVANEDKKIIGSLNDKTNPYPTINGTVNVGAFVGKIDSSCKDTEKVIHNCYVNNLNEIKSNARAKNGELNTSGFVGSITKSCKIENILVGSIKRIIFGFQGESSIKNTKTAVGTAPKETTYLNCIAQNNQQAEVVNTESWKLVDKIDGNLIGSTISDPAWKSLGSDKFPVLKSQTFDPNNALFVTPNKTEYYVGENFDISGIKLSGKQQFMDNPFEIKHYVLNYSNYNKEAKGGYKILVSALGFETSFSVQVRNIKVVGLDIKLNKENVYYGDSIVKEDFVISYLLENGTLINVNDPILDYITYPTENPDSDIKFSYESSNYVLGDNKVSVSIGEMKAETIVKAIENDVVKIELQSNPLKSDYNVGDVFDPTGMQVKATYMDNSTQIVPNEDLEIMGENISIGENSIVMSYGKYKTCNYVVNGNDVEYTINFKNDDDSVISTQTYHYGNQVVPPEDPIKAPDNTYTYTFAGWDKPITSCKGNKDYKATYNKEFINYVVEFKNDDDTVISTRTYHYGDNIIIPDNPTKKADDTYTYTFREWNKPISTCNGDAVFIATYDSTYIEYTITFQDEDGSVLSKTNYHYGDDVVEPVDPTKQEDNTYTYVFNGWNYNVVKCMGNATYTAVYRSIFKDYKVVFKNDDGTVISTLYYHYGDTVIEPSNVYKPSDAYSYEFTGWDKEITICTGDAVYVATYKQVERLFTIKFLNYDGTLIDSKTYHYGDVVVAPENVVRENTVEYKYTFVGWDNNVTNCNGDAVYTATFKSTLREYVVQFENEDGVLLSKKTYHYGDKVTIPNEPTKKSDNTYDYIFDGWNENITNCLKDVTYTATYKATYIEYEVIFKNDDGTLISKSIYHFNDDILGPTEVSKLSNVYEYTFTGWDKEVGKCSGNQIFTAQFTKKYIDYKIIFQLEDGTVISTNKYHYGDKIIVPVDPIKESDNTYKYLFKSWNKPITACSQDITYTAVFEETYINYTIKFINWDGSLVSEKTYHYGDRIFAPSTAPTRPDSGDKKYSFAGWEGFDIENATCDGNHEYIAKYTIDSSSDIDNSNDNLNSNTSNDSVKTLTKNQKIGIGVGVPIGVIVLGIIIAAIAYYIKKSLK